MIKHYTKREKDWHVTPLTDDSLEMIYVCEKK